MKDYLKERKNREPGLTACPNCGSDKVWRILGTKTEQLVDAICGGKQQVKTYMCRACQHTILVYNKEIIHFDKARQQGPLQIPFAVCSTCHKSELVLHLPSEEASETAFAKLSCLACKAETNIMQVAPSKKAGWQ